MCCSDDPDEVDGMVFLNCAALNSDGGDCIVDEQGCEFGYVVAPCVVEAHGLPPVCVPAEWVGDGSCDVLIEDGYGLNCSDTNWDGGDCLRESVGEVRTHYCVMTQYCYSISKLSADGSLHLPCADG